MDCYLWRSGGYGGLIAIKARVVLSMMTCELVMHQSITITLIGKKMWFILLFDEIQCSD